MGTRVEFVRPLPDTLHIRVKAVIQISGVCVCVCNAYAARYLVLRIRSLALLLFSGRHDWLSFSDAAEKCPKCPNWRFQHCRIVISNRSSVWFSSVEEERARRVWHYTATGTRDRSLRTMCVSD